MRCVRGTRSALLQPPRRLKQRTDSDAQARMGEDSQPLAWSCEAAARRVFAQVPPQMYSLCFAAWTLQSTCYERTKLALLIALPSKSATCDVRLSKFSVRSRQKPPQTPYHASTVLMSDTSGARLLSFSFASFFVPRH